MDWQILVVDLDAGETSQEELQHGVARLQEATAPGGESLTWITCCDAAEAHGHLQSNSLLAMVLVVSDWSPEYDKLIRAFQRYRTPDPDHVMVVVRHVSSAIMKGCFEYGVEQILDIGQWVEQASQYVTEHLLQGEGEGQIRTLLFALGQALRSGSPQGLRELAEALGTAAKYSYIAAVAQGHCLEALGSYEAADESFALGERLNRTFVPAIQSAAASKILLGKVEEAIPKLEKLEKMNPASVSRKVMLAIAHTKAGNLEQAKHYLKHATDLDPSDPQLREAKVAFLLSNGRVGEAMKGLESINNAGHFLASKLNELGVRYSQGGQPDKALIVYQRAHRAVKSELRHKISLNAALACHRAQHYEKALKYLQRAKKEYGGTFPKLVRVARAVKQAMAAQRETP